MSRLVQFKKKVFICHFEPSTLGVSLHRREPLYEASLESRFGDVKGDQKSEEEKLLRAIVIFSKQREGSV